MNKKTRSSYILPTRTYLRSKGTHSLKVKDGKRYSLQMVTKRAGVTMLISDKIEFKLKTITRDKEQYMMLMKSVL